MVIDLCIYVAVRNALSSQLATVRRVKGEAEMLKVCHMINLEMDKVENLLGNMGFWQIGQSRR